MNKSSIEITRTEEVQSIIQRMPTTFGRWVTGIILSILILLLGMGYIIRYPDIIMGQLTISAHTAPVSLIATSAGTVDLLVQSQQTVKAGDYLAFIETAADIHDIQKVNKLIRRFQIDVIDMTAQLKQFPKKVTLGELNLKYFSFIQALQQVVGYKQQNLIAKQKESLIQLLSKQQEALQIAKHKLAISLENYELTKKLYDRDVQLGRQKVLAPADLEKSKIGYLNAKDAHQTGLREVINQTQQVQETENRLEQINIQKDEKESQLQLELTTAYTELLDQLEAWEKRYVFIAPISGQVQFLRFWTDNHFIQAGEAVFTLVPQKKDMIGQVQLPLAGAGKVQIGQEVILKLDNYPYAEYGSIKGKVKNIALTPHTQPTKEGFSDYYLVEVELPNQLKTNYGTQLGGQTGIKGSAEVIVHKRRLIERLFDNLRHKI